MRNPKLRAPTNRRQILPVLTWAIVVIAIIIFIGTPVWQAVPLWFDTAFRLNFLGNWTATMLGALVGIPIALALSKWQQSEQDRTQRERLEQDRAKRETFVLSSLREELRVNRDILQQMVEDQKVTPTTASIVGLRDVTWRVLSETGELKWVDDMFALLCISEVYYYIDTLIFLEKQYMHPDFTMGVESKDGTLGYAGERVVLRVNKIRPEALKLVKDGIGLIDHKIGSDIIHSDGTGGLPKTFGP
jgi:hypothetical protein